MQCSNCNCGTCEQIIWCDGCEQILCVHCHTEHNHTEEAGEGLTYDHTEHVAVMKERGMSNEEIVRDLQWHADTLTLFPDYSAAESPI